MKAIDSFRGKYFFLSNFYVHSSGHCVEILYQSEKTLVEDDHQLILNCNSPRAAKALGYKVALRPDWNEVRVPIMARFVAEKFKIQELADLLLNTFPVPLIEGNNWHDNFWGMCFCEKCLKVPKYNWLGHILTRVRYRLYLRSD